ncbi:MAG: DNA-processing protein DprA [Mongoliitalea sp.]
MSATKDELVYELALNLVPKIGPNLYRNIIAYTGSARAFFEIPVGKLGKVPRVGKKLIEYRKSADQFITDANAIIQDCNRKNIRIISFSNPDFPKRLKALDDSPMILYTRGNINLNPERSIGIVGTRNATDYGKSITKKIIEELSPFQPSIISGLAYGIDIEAHKSALQAQLPTIGVLGSSVHQIYPSIHKATAEDMFDLGGLVSEYPPGTEMHPANFPQRNRIIAGLSDAIIVVEAAKKGGALITAEIAYSYNKEVFAVPGNLMSSFSEGCNNLIKQLKASIYTGSKDIEDALSWKKDAQGKTIKKVELDLANFQGEEKEILKLLLEKKELEIDQLSLLLDLSLATLASTLLTLEFQGIIKSLPGKKYRLIA